MISRRAFLALGSLLAPFSSALAGRRLHTDKMAASSEQKDWQAMQEIGRWYLKEYPAEANKQLLMELIEQTKQQAKHISHLAWVDSPNKQAFQYDYQHGQVIYVGGWLMSRTEARLCALSVFSV